jgi:hypothetical protein
MEVVLAGGERIRPVNASCDDNMSNRKPFCRFVEGRFQRNHAAATEGPVGDDDDLGGRILEAIADRRGAEAGEDHRVDCTNTVAGVDGDEGFGDVARVEGDAVASDDAEILQSGRKSGSCVGEGAEGPGLREAVLALVVERHAVAGPAVEAVDAYVAGRAGEVLEIA